MKTNVVTLRDQPDLKVLLRQLGLSVSKAASIAKLSRTTVTKLKYGQETSDSSYGILINALRSYAKDQGIPFPEITSQEVPGGDFAGFGDSYLDMLDADLITHAEKTVSHLRDVLEELGRRVYLEPGNFTYSQLSEAVRNCDMASGEAGKIARSLHRT